MSRAPSRRSSQRSSRRSKPVRTRIRERAAAKGTVWIGSQDRLVPAGSLLDLSDEGVRYRHDPGCIECDGFPVPVPRTGVPLLVAVTLRAGEPPRAVPAIPVRVTPRRDGSVEVACRFEARDSQGMALIHKKYVDASLERARRNLGELRARLFRDGQPPRRQRQPLGQILVKRRAIGRKALSEFLENNRGGVPLGQGLVKAGLVSDRQLAEALSEHVGLPFVDLDVAGVRAEAKGALPPGLAARLGVIPFEVSARTLRVAASRPLRLAEKQEIEAQTRRKVKLFLADPSQIGALLQGRSPRRARPRVPVAVLARYRFYGSALQQLDPRTFEGAAANVSENGMLFGGPVPAKLAADFQKGQLPRVVIATQLFPGEHGKPVVLRFEPMRIAPVAASPGAPSRGEIPDAPWSWIGARISPLLAEDRTRLAQLYRELRGEKE